MSVILMRNNVEGDGPVIAPTRDNGAGYPYCMYFNGNAEVAFAESHLELLDVLMPGYLDVEEAERDYRRIRLAQSVAAQIQAEILVEVSPDDVTEGEWIALTAPRGLSQPRADWWTCRVPLVVVETGYEPFTDIPRPASGLPVEDPNGDNLWFIRPAEEEDFLVSLHEVGYLRMMENRHTGDL